MLQLEYVNEVTKDETIDVDAVKVGDHGLHFHDPDLGFDRFVTFDLLKGYRIAGVVTDRMREQATKYLKNFSSNNPHRNKHKNIG